MISKDDILQALSGDSLVGFLERAGFHVTKNGREWMILCPFHDDHDPSCGWYSKDRRQTWKFKCHGCGAGGDVFSFAAEHSGIGKDPARFDEVVKWMAGFVGVTDVDAALPPDEAKRRRDEQRKRSEERAADAKRIEETSRAASIADARRLWDSLKGCDVGPIAMYLEGRGITVASLPGGVPPPTARFGARVHRTYFERVDDEIVERKEEAPAVVFLGVDVNRNAARVQRIYLDPSDYSKPIAYGFDGKGKKILRKATLGSSMSDGRGGTTVRLAAPAMESGLLVLCEGAETGLAIQAAVGAQGTVWCTLDANGLREFVLPAGEQSAWVKRIVVAGDLDQSRTGQRAMQACAESLWQQVVRERREVSIHTSLPTHELAPRLVTADGKVAA